MKLPTRISRKARRFSEPGYCQKIIRQARWPKGQPVCPDCGSKRIGLISDRKELRCKDCRRQFSPILGTIFEDSPLELKQWFLCLYVMIHYPKPMCQTLSTLLSVTLRTAWQMRRKLKAAMSLIARTGSFQEVLSDIINIPKSDIDTILNKKKRAN